jgi:hypothetical protein
LLNEKSQITDTPVSIIEEKNKILNMEVMPNGPLIIKSDCTILFKNGSLESKKGTTALCRCGSSSKKPYCGGSYKNNGFTG